MADDGTVTFATDRLLTGLRAAVTTICAAVMITASLPRKLDVYHPLWPQVTAFSVVAALLLLEVVLLTLRRSWGRWSIPALVVTFGASALSTWSLAPGQVLSTADWSFGTIAWVVLVLLNGQRLGPILALLLTHASVTFMRVVVLGPSDSGSLVRLLAVSVGTVGFPLAAGIATAVLRDVARRAHAASEEAARIQIEEELRAQVHATRQDRFGAVQEDIEPLLRGLADGTLPVNDPRVRRSCQFQAARMRRLFAETDLVADPLVHELRQGADVTERQGVIVQFETVGSWPIPPAPVRRALADGPLWLLSTAASTASITIIGTENELSVSVLVDGGVVPEEIPSLDLPDVRQQIHSDTGSTWLEVLWLTRASEQS